MSLAAATDPLQIPPAGSHSEKLHRVPAGSKEDAAAIQGHEPEPDPDPTLYPRGIQFALISLSLCLCVFLVGLVSFSIRDTPAIADRTGCHYLNYRHPADNRRVRVGGRCRLVRCSLVSPCLTDRCYTCACHGLTYRQQPAHLLHVTALSGQVLRQLPRQMGLSRQPRPVRGWNPPVGTGTELRDLHHRTGHHGSGLFWDQSGMHGVSLQQPL